MKNDIPIDETPEAERQRVFGACGGKCGEAPCIEWNKNNQRRLARKEAPIDTFGVFPAVAIAIISPYVETDYPTTDRKQKHHDVTGFFQRTGRKGNR